MAAMRFGDIDLDFWPSHHATVASITGAAQVFELS